MTLTVDLSLRRFDITDRSGAAIARVDAGGQLDALRVFAAERGLSADEMRHYSARPASATDPVPVPPSSPENS